MPDRHDPIRQACAAGETVFASLLGLTLVLGWLL